METIIFIIVGTLTGAGAILGAGYKCYKEMYNQEQNGLQLQQVQNVQNVSQPSPVFEKALKNAIKHHYEQTEAGCDSDTEIDIKINTHTHDVIKGMLNDDLD